VTKKIDSGVDLLSIQKHLLDSMFKKAHEQGEDLRPDEAMRRMYDGLRTLVGDGPDTLLQNDLPQVDPEAVYRAAYHHAVDLYCQYLRSKTDASEYSESHYAYLLQLREEGLSHGQIAIKLGWPMGTLEDQQKSKDKVRKRIKVAKNRLRPGKPLS
jgi:hypothetical protein